MKIDFILLCYACMLCTSCVQAPAQAPETAVPTDFNAYWYAGLAEVNSYKLEQARYGELRQGEAVLVFVTEPFSKTKQVKADNPGPGDYNVMKLNLEKKFMTGIYPYSMLNSSFVPVEKPGRAHAVKVTSSVQEWCGHAFTQLNRRDDKFEVELRSYFESEGDQDFTLPVGWLEDELWSTIRLNPAALPLGEFEIVPAFFYCRLLHKELKAYRANASLQTPSDGVSVYMLYYPDLNRTLKIRFGSSFPYAIEGWEESYIDGWGAQAKLLTTKAEKIKSLRLDYWTKNSNQDAALRQALGL